MAHSAARCLFPSIATHVLMPVLTWPMTSLAAYGLKNAQPTLPSVATTTTHFTVRRPDDNQLRDFNMANSLEQRDMGLATIANPAEGTEQTNSFRFCPIALTSSDGHEKRRQLGRRDMVAQHLPRDPEVRGQTVAVDHVVGC